MSIVFLLIVGLRGFQLRSKLNVNLPDICCKLLSSRIYHFLCNYQSWRASWVISVVGVEWRDSYEGVLSIIIDEFSKGKELIPVILLIITKDAKVLLEDLIDPLGLTV